MAELISTYVVFFAVIDPIGTIPVFIAVTSGLSEPAKRRTAIKATLISAAILVFFVIAGEFILIALDSPLSAFQIAGGVVLFLFALTMIFGDSKPDEELKMAKSGNDTAVFPLSVPSIASPGAMLAAVMLTENERFQLWEQAETVGIMLLVLLTAMLFMIGASFIHRLIGNSGASIISRVMGLILASVAVQNMLNGIKGYFEL